MELLGIRGLSRTQAAVANKKHAGSITVRAVAPAKGKRLPTGSEWAVGARFASREDWHVNPSFLEIPRRGSRVRFGNLCSRGHGGKTMRPPQCCETRAERVSPAEYRGHHGQLTSGWKTQKQTQTYFVQRQKTQCMVSSPSGLPQSTGCRQKSICGHHLGPETGREFAS